MLKVGSLGLLVIAVAACGGDDESGSKASGGAGGIASGGGGAGTGGLDSGGASGAATGGTGASGGSGGNGGTGGLPSGGTGGGSSGAALRFFGTGQNDVDRVKIRIDDESNVAPGPPVDVGAEDFTIEFWIRANAADNPAGAIGCGGYTWISGNIVFDRDRYNQGRAFGISIAGGVVVFGVQNENGESETICGTTGVLDGAWHHVAVARRRSDGHIWVFIDGKNDAEGDGPDGDVSYPDDGVPGNFCGGPCTFSDPFIVIGAEKHDAGSSYPSYSGSFDELRISKSLRYTADFTRPTGAFGPDPECVGLYHFDEGSGLTANDSSGAAGGPSPGSLNVGGPSSGPQWTNATPF